MRSDEYINTLDDMRAFFRKNLVDAVEISNYLGIDPRTVRKWYGVPAGGITLPVLATRIVTRTAQTTKKSAG